MDQGKVIRRGLVVPREVVVEGGFQLGDALDGATTDALSGDLGEEVLDHVEPRGRRRREVDVETRAIFQLSFDLRCPVGAAVVDDQVDVQFGQGLAVDPVQDPSRLAAGAPVINLGHSQKPPQLTGIARAPRQSAKPGTVKILAKPIRR